VQDERDRGSPPVEPAEDRAAAEETREGFGRQWQPALYLRLLAISLAGAFAIAFVLENNKHVSVHFVVGTKRASLIWVILLSVGLGIVLGVLLSQLYRRRRRRK
jgi:uncharacterized integral membrane protein